MINSKHLSITGRLSLGIMFNNHFGVSCIWTNETIAKFTTGADLSTVLTAVLCTGSNICQLM